MIAALFESDWDRAWFDIECAMVHYINALNEGDDPERIAIVGPKVGEAFDRMRDVQKRMPDDR